MDPHSQGLLSFLAWILAGTLAVTAAGSFARERDSGVMELLLVTPLGERGIIAGRLRGIAGQYLPAVLLLLGLWLLATLRDGAETVRFWFFAVSFLTLPVTGLYFSLRCRNRVHALAWTFAVGLALPLLVNRVGANQVGIGTDAWPPFLSRQAVARFVEWTQLSRTKVQAGVVWPLLRDGPEILQSDLVPIAVQLSSAIVFSLLLQRNLRQRRFALEQT